MNEGPPTALEAWELMREQSWVRTEHARCRAERHGDLWRCVHDFDTGRYWVVVTRPNENRTIGGTFCRKWIADGELEMLFRKPQVFWRWLSMTVMSMYADLELAAL